MSSRSTVAAATSRGSSSRGDGSARSLHDSRRLYELAGFLTAVIGLMVLLSLISYAPKDASLDSSTPVGLLVRNWVGLAGSYTADALFQSFGWAAYLIPMGLFVVASRLLLVHPFEAPKTKAVGAVMLLASSVALLELFPYTPPIKGLIRGSGLAGYLVAVGLVKVFNPVGASIISVAIFLTSLFLVTKFSFSSAFTFARTRLNFVRPISNRWSRWREARQQARLRREVERARVIGKPPVILQQAPTLSGRAAAKPKNSFPSTKDSSDSDDAQPPVVVSPEEAQGAKGRSAKTTSSTETPKIIGRGGHTYKLPHAPLLHPPEGEQTIDEEELKERATRLKEKLAEFGVMGNVTQIHPGPVVTTFEYKPEAGIKYSRITGLVDDLCLATKAESILIDRIPGKSTVGIEVPNAHREIIYLRELIESSDFASSPSKLTLCLGKDITGKFKISDLGQMPHLLIAGSTGSGKSVAINCMIVSILYKSSPAEAKLILIDPKRLELGLYEGVPHLLTPIVTEPKQAANALMRATLEMEARLKKLAGRGVRNIEQYNKLFESESTLDLFDSSGEQDGPLPYIVIVIDELADLMMVEPQGVEESITRLAQMARAVGIHLILATQRPSVDVITGLIKANLPSRISFRVASKVDSRTILDSNGAEALLGRGDMLFLPPGTSRLLRLHGPFVTEKEIGKVVEWWKSQCQPQYNEEFLKPIKDKDRNEQFDDLDEDSGELDEVYEEAVRIVVESGKASTSLLQRRMRLGYGRAARLIDLMEKDGIVSAPDGSKPREVLKRPDWLEEIDSSLR